jgi:hypothetical protein
MQNKLREVCFCGIHPVVVYQISTDLSTAVNHNEVLLVSSVYATCFGCVDLPQALKYVSFET